MSQFVHLGLELEVKRVCKYLLECTYGRDINYSTHILRDTVIRGLADPEIQLDLLSDANQDMSLKEVFQFVEKKEAGRRSANRLLDSQSTISVSQYRKNQRNHHKDLADNKSEPCNCCRKRDHGRNASSNIRKTNFPAYNATCDYCDKKHHFASVYRKKIKDLRNPSNTHVLEADTLDSLCISFEFGNNIYSCSFTLDHHLFNNLSEQWVSKASRPQPFVPLAASVAHKDYQTLGFHVKKSTQTAKFSAMADTGCQSCLIGVHLLKRFGFSNST